MASVKGILVEIGGDTSGLQKALNKVNTMSSSLSKELRNINSLLKLDPKNTTLLSNKQEVLNEQIENTSNKLKELKEAQERADNELLESGKISRENYRALQEEIIKTEQKLNSLNAENSKWNKAGDSLVEFGNKITSISDKIDKLGTTLTTRLTLPIVGIGTILVNSAKDFETAFTGVEKTVDGTEEQLAKLKQGIKDLSEEIPSTTKEISAVAESAGQLGVAVDDVLDFTKVMINLGNSTNISAEEASVSIAQLYNVLKDDISTVDKFGSALVDLGNNSATSESKILDMTTRIAGSGTQIGLTTQQILALATSLSSVGIEAEMGGSAISTIMTNIDKEVALNGKHLKTWAETAGMSASDFKKKWASDTMSALQAVIKGMGNAKNEGENLNVLLDDLGIKNVRQTDTMKRLTNASELLTKSIKIANDAWNDNTALSEEAGKRYKTLDSRVEMTKNKFRNLATTMGDKMTPTANQLLDKVDKLIDKFDNLSEEELENIIKTGALVASIGPAVKILGTLGHTTGTTITTLGNFSKAIANVKNGVTVAEGQVGTFTKILGAMTSPMGIATTAIVASTVAIIYAMENAEKETKEAFSNMGNGASDFISGISSAKSHLKDFNSTLFASSEEQEKLKQQMSEIQKGITDICQKASDERRGYTQQEIVQLDEYFTKLRELNQREIEIQQSIANAITQQAVTNAEIFQGSLDEYKTQSQEWLKTALDQKDKTIEIIENQSIEEIALLNQRYGDEANLQNEAYATEYNNIISQKQEKIDTANSEVAKISRVYADGYLQRSKQNEGFYTKLTEYNQKVENENSRNANNLERIQNNYFLTESNKLSANESENYRHQNEIKKIWKKMYKDMDESQEEQLGVWLASVAQTELYGGKIEDETKQIVDTILSSYDSMPAKTRESMKNAMSPMLEEMERTEPGLFAKANNIANGILSRLRKSFDIHSPSRKMRKIFNFVMEGAELGFEDEEGKFYRKVDNFAEEITDKFNEIPKLQDLGNLYGNINRKIIDSTKTVFTTPNVNIYTNDLSKEKMQQILDFLNKKLGSAY